MLVEATRLAGAGSESGRPELQAVRLGGCWGVPVPERSALLKRLLW